jgi:hypothetical protein
MARNSLFISNLTASPWHSKICRESLRSKRSNSIAINNLAKNDFYFSWTQLADKIQEERTRKMSQIAGETAAMHLAAHRNIE